MSLASCYVAGELCGSGELCGGGQWWGVWVGLGILWCWRRCPSGPPHSLARQLGTSSQVSLVWLSFPQHHHFFPRVVLLPLEPESKFFSGCVHFFTPKLH